MALISLVVLNLIHRDLATSKLFYNFHVVFVNNVIVEVKITSYYGLALWACHLIFFLCKEHLKILTNLLLIIFGLFTTVIFHIVLSNQKLLYIKFAHLSHIWNIK